MTIDRRGLLGLMGAGAAGPALADALDGAGARPAFLHGVASGDPGHDRVLLWTRVTAGRPVELNWQVARDPGFAKPVAQGGISAGPDRDFTAKADVAGLKAGTDYFYRFRIADQEGWIDSPTGRTRTLPKESAKDVVLAVCTCALYPNGYFNAYGAIAGLPRVDAVVHLGDYIYEYGGAGSYGMDSPVATERPHDPPHDCVTLADYRRRHAQYRSDPQLQSAHARAPWIVVWDDHETADDSWVGGAKNHHPATQGDWSARKAAAIRAYFEWMPIREPEGGGFAINRGFDFGDVASLFMLETRLTARDQQIYATDLSAGGTEGEVEAFRNRLADPGRKMMSSAQEAWLRDGLVASVRSGRAWQVLGNEVVMARVAAPPMRKLMGEAAYDAALEKMPAAGRGWAAALQLQAARNLPFGTDDWDGYPADRQRLYDMFSGAKANVVVLSGDSHAFWANELHDAKDGEAGERVAVEFGTTSISSPCPEDVMPGLPIGELMVRHNREVKWSDHRAKGFIRLTLTHRDATAEMMAVSTIASRNYSTAVLKAFRVMAGPIGVSDIKDA